MIIGDIQNLPIGGPMLQCVTFITKIMKNRVILRLLLCFVLYMHKQCGMHKVDSGYKIQFVSALVLSAILTAVV